MISTKIVMTNACEIFRKLSSMFFNKFQIPTALGLTYFQKLTLFDPCNNFISWRSLGVATISLRFDGRFKALSRILGTRSTPVKFTTRTIYQYLLNNIYCNELAASGTIMKAIKLKRNANFNVISYHICSKRF